MSPLYPEDFFAARVDAHHYRDDAWDRARHTLEACERYASLVKKKLKN